MRRQKKLSTSSADVTQLDIDAAANVFVPETKFTAVEVCFDLRLNGKSFRQIFYSPNDLEDLTVGVLAQAGEIFSADDDLTLTRRTLGLTRRFRPLRKLTTTNFATCNSARKKFLRARTNF